MTDTCHKCGHRPATDGGILCDGCRGYTPAVSLSGLVRTVQLLEGAGVDRTTRRYLLEVGFMEGLELVVAE